MPTIIIPNNHSFEILIDPYCPPDKYYILDSDRETAREIRNRKSTRILNKKPDLYKREPIKKQTELDQVKQSGMY